MKKVVIVALTLAVVCQAPAHAISEKYRQQLARSGCTQLSEQEGCDIHKTREQNANAGFVGAGSSQSVGGQSALANDFSAFVGNYVAKHKTGEHVADIHIEAQMLYVDGKELHEVNRVGDILTFKVGYVVYTLNAKDPGKSQWQDSDAGSAGPIIAE